MTAATWFDAHVVSHRPGGFVDHADDFAIRDVSTVRLTPRDGSASRDVRIVFEALPDRDAATADEGPRLGPDVLRHPGARVAVAIDAAAADLDVLGAGAIVAVGEPQVGDSPDAQPGDPSGDAGPSAPDRPGGAS